MKIRISDPVLAEDLLAFLRRAGCVAALESVDMIRASIPRSLNEEAARHELDLYLRTWEATRREAQATLVP